MNLAVMVILPQPCLNLPIPSCFMLLLTASTPLPPARPAWRSGAHLDSLFVSPAARPEPCCFEADDETVEPATRTLGRALPVTDDANDQHRRFHGARQSGAPMHAIFVKLPGSTTPTRWIRQIGMQHELMGSISYPRSLPRGVRSTLTYTCFLPHVSLAPRLLQTSPVPTPANVWMFPTTCESDNAPFLFNSSNIGSGVEGLPKGHVYDDLS